MMLFYFEPSNNAPNLLDIELNLTKTYSAPQVHLLKLLTKFLDIELNLNLFFNLKLPTTDQIYLILKLNKPALQRITLQCSSGTPAIINPLLPMGTLKYLKIDIILSVLE